MTSSPARVVQPRRLLLLRAALCVYLVLLAWALLAPTNTDQSGMVVWLAGRLIDLQVPAHLVTFVRLEVIMNAVIVAPVSYLGAAVLPRSSWRDWTAYAFVGSATVETVQSIFLPGRQGSFSDIVANTAGGFIGAVAWWLIGRSRAAGTSPRVQ